MYDRKIEGMTYKLTELSALRHRNAKTLGSRTEQRTQRTNNKQVTVTVEWFSITLNQIYSWTENDKPKYRMAKSETIEVFMHKNETEAIIHLYPT